MLPRYYKLERILGAMRRFHAKIQRIRDGVEAFYPTPPPGGADGTPSVIYIKPNPGDDTNTLTDYVLAFFIFSHSLKDWIINDDDIGGLKKDRIEHVEAFINNNNCLMIAADIANGAKHLERYYERSGFEPDWILPEYKTTIVIVDGYPRQIVKSSGTIYSKKHDREIDALTLATECLSKWEEFTGEIYKAQKDLKKDKG